MKPKSGKEVMLYNGNKKGILSTSVAVDPVKLRRLIEKRQMMLSEVSTALGFASNTLSGQLNSGVISGPMVIGLKDKFNINRDEYEYTPPVDKEKTTLEATKEQAETLPIEATALYDVMKAAFVDAINEAFTANMKKIASTISAAVSYSLKLEAMRTKSMKGGAE